MLNRIPALVQPSGRNHLIDSLRLCAASAVVLFHLNQPIPPTDNWYRNLCAQLWLGVPVFFVISGYCIFIAVEHTINTPKFLLRRFFRVFPPYWFSLICVALTVGMSIIAHGVNSVAILPKSFTDIIATLTLLTSPFSRTPTVNWVYWSLTYEVFFYLVTGLIILLHKRYWLPVILTISVIAALSPPQSHGPFFWLQQWPVFSLGIAVYYLQKNNQGWLSTLLVAVSLAGIFRHHSYPPYFLLSLLTAMAILVNAAWPLPANRVSGLGDYSYGIYLLHVPLGCNILLWFKNDQIQHNVGLNIAFDLAILGVVIGVSALVHIYVEKPFIRYGKVLSTKF